MSFEARIGLYLSLVTFWDSLCLSCWYRLGGSLGLGSPFSTVAGKLKESLLGLLSFLELEVTGVLVRISIISGLGGRRCCLFGLHLLCLEVSGGLLFEILLPLVLEEAGSLLLGFLSA